jgi:hypothetical protein
MSLRSGCRSVILAVLIFAVPVAVHAGGLYDGLSVTSECSSKTNLSLLVDSFAKDLGMASSSISLVPADPRRLHSGSSWDVEVCTDSLRGKQYLDDTRFALNHLKQVIQKIPPEGREYLRMSLVQYPPVGIPLPRPRVTPDPGWQGLVILSLEHEVEIRYGATSHDFPIERLTSELQRLQYLKD